MPLYRFSVEEHEGFAAWLRGVTDPQARATIAWRIDRLRRGRVGRVQSAGKGVFEVFIERLPQVRLFVHRQGPLVTVLHGTATEAHLPAHARHALRLARRLAPVGA